VPREVTCTRCGHLLHIPDDLAGAAATCPRCLNEITAPLVNTSITTVEPISPDACHRCGKRVEESWHVCPHCTATLRSHYPIPQAPSLDRDIRRDHRGVKIGLAVLVGLFVVGLILFLIEGGWTGLQSGDLIAVILLVLGVVVFAVVACMVVVFGSSAGPEVKAASGALGGCALGMTVALATVLVVVLVIVSAIIGFFAECTKSCQGPARATMKEPPRGGVP
jgi:hypothetical protein